MSSVSFEATLIPRRTLWDVVRLTWTPMLVAIALMALSARLDAVSPAAASVVTGLGMVCMFGGIGYVTFAWQRGPSITVADGALAVGKHARAPLRELGTEVGTYVMAWRAGYSRGISWSPLLTLRFPDNKVVRVGCQGAGGPADGRKPTAQPEYDLPRPQWDQLVALLGPPSAG